MGHERGEGGQGYVPAGQLRHATGPHTAPTSTASKQALMIRAHLLPRSLGRAAVHREQGGLAEPLNALYIDGTKEPDRRPLPHRCHIV